MQLQYPAAGNINLSAGVAEFWVALGFDAAEVIKKPGCAPQSAFSHHRRAGRTPRLRLLHAGEHLRRQSGTSERQLVCYGVFPVIGRRTSGITWNSAGDGNWNSGATAAARSPRTGRDCLARIDVQPEDLRLLFGSYIGYSDVECEYALDEFRILGPGGEQVPDYPTMTIPRIKPPMIDGRIDRGRVGRRGADDRLRGPQRADAGRMTQTIVRAGWDDEALYLCYECLDPQKRPLTARLTESRRVDLFRGRRGCDPAARARSLSLLSPGRQRDRHPLRRPARSQQRGQVTTRVSIPAWTVATSSEPGRWVVECKIPFKELEGRAAPKDGERWRANFCRDADSLSRYSSWAFAAGNFHRIENFGEIVFSRSDRGIRLGPLGDWAMGKLNAQVELTGLLFSTAGDRPRKSRRPGCQADPRNREPPGRLSRGFRSSRPRSSAGSTTSPSAPPRPRATCIISDLPLRVIKPYDIAVEGYPYEGKLWVTANVAGLGGDAQRACRARRACCKARRSMARCETADFQHGLGKPPPSTWSSCHRASTSSSPRRSRPDGKVLATAEADFEQFAKPAVVAESALASIIRFPSPGRRCEWATRASPCGDDSTGAPAARYPGRS